MESLVTCRGCKAPVSRTASFCFVCKCPHPTCHLTESAAEGAAADRPDDAPMREPHRVGAGALLKWLAALGRWFSLGR